MNILVGILKYPPDYAGDGLRLHRAFKRFKAQESVQDVYVLTSWDQSAQRAGGVRDGISIFRPIECTLKLKFKKPLVRLGLAFQMVRLIVCYLSLSPKIDIVLTSGSGWFPSLVAWLAFFTRKPVVKEIVLLGSDDPFTLQKSKPGWLRWFFIAPFKFARLIIAISPALEQPCLAFGIPQEKIWCRLNAVDFDIDAAQIRALAPREETPTILWVGTVSERKNVLFLLEAARYLQKPARVRFIGPCNDEKYFRQLEEVRKKIPAHVRIEFSGTTVDREELIRLYCQSALFWFASKKEGMGNVVAESLVCGTPVITLPVMGVMRSVMQNLEDGEIVETQDPREFARVVDAWLDRKVDRQAISKRARERFNTAKVDAQYVTLFRRILHREDAPKLKRTQESPIFASGKA